MLIRDPILILGLPILSCSERTPYSFFVSLHPPLAQDGPHIKYLKALAEWDADFPGFEGIVEGVSEEDGEMRVRVFPRDFTV